MLANPRPVDPQKGNRNVAFDVNLPVKDGRNPTLGLLRYFTPENRVSELQKLWDNTFTEAFIIAKIAAMPESGISHDLIEDDDVFEYAFVGDITDIIFAENTDIHHNPCIIASGIVDEFDSANLTFTIHPSQYINLPHTVLDCQLSCVFDPDSKKWKNKKPMPTTGSTISVTGPLTKITRGFDRKPKFQIELDNIAYLNRSTTTSTSTQQSTSTSFPTSRKRFNYNSTLPSSSTSTSSPTVLGKRKETNDQQPDPSAEHRNRSHTASSDENSSTNKRDNSPYASTGDTKHSQIASEKDA